MRAHCVRAHGSSIMAATIVVEVIDGLDLSAMVKS
jgi:hypothetical protein